MSLSHSDCKLGNDRHGDRDRDRDRDGGTGTGTGTGTVPAAPGGHRLTAARSCSDGSSLLNIVGSKIASGKFIVHGLGLRPCREPSVDIAALGTL